LEPKTFQRIILKSLIVIEKLFIEELTFQGTIAGELAVSTKYLSLWRVRDEVDSLDISLELLSASTP
jgi:hypothetical protein